MYTAIVTAPSAFLFSYPAGGSITDELLSGWLVTVREQRGDFLKITTQYGYTGWLKSWAVRQISPKESSVWDIQNQNTCKALLLCRGTTDILKEPKVQASVLCTLFMGSSLLSLGAPEGGWQPVKTAAGICGYLPFCSLQPCPVPVPVCCLSASEQQKLRAAVIRYACSYLGTQYRWGGKTHEGLDCSGLTFMSYYMCGILIYRDAAIVEGYPVHEIPLSQIQAGDLLYFPGHIALYTGNDKYIHSTGNPASFGCVINSLNPEDKNYREDLACSLTAAGSVFP